MVTNEMSITAPPSEQKAGRPRDARLDEAILKATVELLEEHGYFDVSLAAIAQRAVTTTPAIYRRWSSKADLVVQAVFRIEGDDVVADTGDLAQTSPPWCGGPSGSSADLPGEPRWSDCSANRTRSSSVVVPMPCG